MSNGREPGGAFGRLLRNIRSAFSGNKTINPAQTSERGPAGGATATIAASVTTKAAPVAAANAAPAPSASELINEGLRQRQRAGSEAARPYFERAAQLEPNSHVPWFMLGNVASELGDLDVAVAHYEHARDLHPSDHVVRYNLGLNQLSRGYIDA